MRSESGSVLVAVPVDSQKNWLSDFDQERKKGKAKSKDQVQVQDQDQDQDQVQATSKSKTKPKRNARLNEDENIKQYSVEYKYHVNEIEE